MKKETSRKSRRYSDRTEVVRKHFWVLFTDTTNEVLPAWIEQRWPREVLKALPRVDAERVREITWMFRKKTSRADDHVVIEMVRELEMDIWEELHSASSTEC